MSATAGPVRRWAAVGALTTLSFAIFVTIDALVVRRGVMLAQARDERVRDAFKARAEVTGRPFTWQELPHGLREWLGMALVDGVLLLVLLTLHEPRRLARLPRGHVMRRAGVPAAAVAVVGAYELVGPGAYADWPLLGMLLLVAIGATLAASTLRRVAVTSGLLLAAACAPQLGESLQTNVLYAEPLPARRARDPVLGVTGASRRWCSCHAVAPGFRHAGAQVRARRARPAGRRHRQRSSSIGSICSPKEPLGLAAARSCLSSASNASNRSPNRCGAAYDSE